MWTSMLMVMGTHRDGAALAFLRSQAGLSQQVVATRLGVSQKSYSNRETGITRVTPEFRDKFLEAIGANTDDWERVLDQVRVDAPLSAEIPLFETIAAAGRYAFVADCDDTQGAKMVDRGRAKHPCAFAVTVHGDSMAPALLDGDIIICEPILDEHDRYRLVDGRVVAVFAPDALTAVQDVDNQTRQPIKPVRAQPLPVPQAGAVGRWRWLAHGEAKLEKDNPKAVPLTLPAEHVTTLRVAMVIELRREKF